MATANQLLDDHVIRRQIGLERIGNTLTRQIVAILNTNDAVLIATIEKWLSTRLTRKRIKAMLKELREIIKNSVSPVYPAMVLAMKDLVKAEISSGVNALNQAVLINLGIKAPKAAEIFSEVNQETIRGRRLMEWSRGLGRQREQRLSDIIRNGLQARLTTRQIVTQARDALGTERIHAETIVRSAIGHFTNRAREAVFEENSNVINHYVWLSTLDGRTSPICRARSAKKYTLDHKPINHRLPWLGGPGNAHFRCRSALVAHVKTFREIAGTQPAVRLTEPVAAFTARLRRQGVSEMDIAAAKRRLITIESDTTTWSQWIKRQPADFQRDVLGPTRYRLFKAGKPIEKFVNRDGSTKTIKQLAQEEDEFWSRANLKEAA